MLLKYAPTVAFSESLIGNATKQVERSAILALDLEQLCFAPKAHILTKLPKNKDAHAYSYAQTEQQCATASCYNLEGIELAMGWCACGTVRQCSGDT